MSQHTSIVLMGIAIIILIIIVTIETVWFDSRIKNLEGKLRVVKIGSSPANGS